MYQSRAYRMFPTLVECGDSLLKFVDKYAEKGQTLEVRDILARYTTNIIASVCNTTTDGKFLYGSCANVSL